jgi:integrase
LPKRSTAKSFTAKGIENLKAAPTGERYEVYDRDVAGFGIRVTDKGRKSFFLYTRLPAAKPGRCSLGEYSSASFSLEDAREKAREWRKLVKRGIDPRADEERQRQAAISKQALTLKAVAEAFITDKLPGERKGKEVERNIRKELLPKLGSKPISEITDLHIIELVKTIKRRGAPAQARNILGIVKRFFNWAVAQREYGIAASPAEKINPKPIIGEKVDRKRVLDDRELFALWRNAKRTQKIHGRVYELLVLSALRLNEAADASRSEFDFDENVWVVPAARMKGKNSKARPHAVPLTAEIRAVINKTPRLKGEYIFSTTGGRVPVSMSDKAKKRIDKRMLHTLRALARFSGEDSEKVKLPEWVNHDIRQTARSRLSRLKISEEAREAVLAHAKQGIKKVYDHHDYFEEKREALELWAQHLRALEAKFTSRRPSNVVALRAPA